MVGESLGHYQILDKVGAGAMGVVYRAHDTRLDRDVALKVLPADVFSDPHARQRFRKEALALSRTNHPNIAAIYDFDTDAGVDFLVMELVPGEPLSHTLARGPLPADQAASLGLQLADALDAAHREHIIHRDIKPGNLKRTADGRLKVLDFGIARMLAGTEDPTRTGTSTAMNAAGTLPYMAPEQLRGQPADVRSDIYSAGVVLFEMVTGRRPFPQRDPAPLMHAIVHDPVPPPRASPGEAPAPIEGVILKCLEKEPDRRYQSAREMAIDLRRIVAPSSPAVVTPRPATLRRAAPWIGATAAAAALLASPSLLHGPRKTPVDVAPAAVDAAGMLKIGMLPPRDLAHDRGAPWNDVVAALFSSELTGAPRVGFVDPLSLGSLVRGVRDDDRGDGVRALLTSLGIGMAVESVILKVGDGFELHTTVLNPRTGETQFSTTAKFAGEDGLPDAVRLIAARLMSFVDLQQGGLGDKDVRAWISLRTQNIESVKAFALANRYIFTFQPEQVDKYLRRAIDVDPDFIPARLWLISGLMTRGDVEEAKLHYAHLKTLEAKASPFEQTMIAYAGATIAGDLPAQARYLELALKYSPGNNILLFNLAGTRARLGDCDQALRMMRPLVDSGWQYSPLYSFWGVCAIRTNQLEDARRGLKKGLQLPAVDPNVHALLEALAIARGENDEAERQRTLMDERNKELHRRPSSTLIGIYELLDKQARLQGNPHAADALAARAQQLRTASESPH